MSPFRHRRFIRKRKRQASAPMGDYQRIAKGLPNSGMFVKVVSSDLTRHNGSND